MCEREHSLTTLMERVATQTQKKDLWAEYDDPVSVTNMIREEADELVEAVNNDSEAFEVASEIGDVLYLALKLCHQLGIRPEDAVQMKILRNDLKYPTDTNSNGDYYESRDRSKTLWKAMGGDVAFSHAYLEFVSGEPEERSNGHKPQADIDQETVVYVAPGSNGGGDR